MALVLDHGGGDLKVGISKEAGGCPLLMPNVKARSRGTSERYLADQVDGCKDVSSLRWKRPFDRGQCVAWEGQREIWDRVFHEVMGVDPAETDLLVTEPMFTLDALKKELDETVFEKYGFRACYVTSAASLSMEHARRSLNNPIAKSGCGIVIDAGFSSTHVIPCFDGRVMNYAVKRLDVGGRALTNYMKELISFRSIDVSEETYVVDKIKEETCFCSMQFTEDLVAAGRKRNQGPFSLEYVLPDGVNHMRGFVRRKEHNGIEEARTRDTDKFYPEQILHINNERFVVPECLFRPSMIGIDQAGLHEAVIQALEETHPSLHGLLLSNVVLTGGCTNLPNFRARLERELRPLLADHYDLHIEMPPNPVTWAWEGGRMLARTERFQRMLVTREEYHEEGHLRIRRRFST